MPWRALVLGLITGLGHGFFYFGVSAFVKPWGVELGLSRSAAGSAVALGRLNAGWVTLLAGGLADRFGPRRVALTGCAMTATGLAGTVWVSSTWQLAVTWGLMTGVGIALAFTVVLDKALMAQYPPVQHGRALGLRFAAIAAASFVAAMGAGVLTEHWSWRAACGVWAVVMTICFGLLWWLVPRGAGPAGESRREGGPDGVTLAQAVRTADFWRLAAVSAVAAGSVTGVTAHLAALLTDRGVPPLHAATLVSLTILLSLPGRAVAGAWADRWTARRQARSVSLAMAAQALALGWLAWGSSTATAYLAPVAFGLASGLPVPLLIVSPARRFGTRHYGAIQGAVLVVQTVLTVGLPIGLGASFDLSGDYRWGLVVCAALLAAAAALALGLRLVPGDPPDVRMT
jgi:MFS family permease